MQSACTLLLLLCSTSLISQAINFDLDDMSTGGGHANMTRTSTEVLGMDTYVLTMAVSGGYSLINANDIGGGDIYAFGASGSGNYQITFSITQNGSPISFDLTSVAVTDLSTSPHNYQNGDGQNMGSFAGGTQTDVMTNNNTNITSFLLEETSGLNNLAFSDILINNATVLPVELTNFSASFVDQQIKLKWSTVSELNNAGFEIQRSTNAKHWTPIYFLPGAGNSQKLRDYSFVDEHPNEARNYYRLKQTDYDGSTTYSKIISVDVHKDQFDLGKFSPNPISDPYTSVHFILPAASVWNITIFDYLGKKYLSQNWALNQGENKLNFDFPGLPSGSYLVKFENKTQRFIRKLNVISRR